VNLCIIFSFSFFHVYLYTYCVGRFIVLIRLPSPFHPPSPSRPTQGNCKKFYHSVSYMYLKPINHIPLPLSPPFTLLPQTSIPHHTHCIYFTVLSFIFNFKVNIQNVFSMYPSCEYT
jgi:hypothetical protein